MKNVKRYKDCVVKREDVTRCGPAGSETVNVVSVVRQHPNFSEVLLNSDSLFHEAVDGTAQNKILKEMTLMQYEVILHNRQGASFTQKCDSKKACQNYLDSFSDPENLTGRIVDADTGEEVAIKKHKRFSWL